MDKVDLGNNESLVTGVYPNQNGTFTALTLTKRKEFKTKHGAERWLNRQMLNEWLYPPHCYPRALASEIDNDNQVCVTYSHV